MFAGIRKALSTTPRLILATAVLVLIISWAIFLLQNPHERIAAEEAARLSQHVQNLKKDIEAYEAW